MTPDCQMLYLRLLNVSHPCGTGFLGLYNNKLISSLPTQLGQLKFLESFGAHNNRLTGSVPSEIGLASKLSQLLLSNNVFISSTVPTEIGRLTSLELLDLGTNKISGPIPSEIGGLSKLGKYTCLVSFEKVLSH